MIGDAAGDSDKLSATNHNGSCFPRFYFTKLIPKVYEDDNNTLQTTDTKVTVDNLLWMEYVLRAMCEGFVDREASVSALCEHCTDPFPDICAVDRRLYDYTWENLNAEANGGRWMYFLPLKVRADGREGFGPMPNLYIYAEHFNQLSRAINALTRARVPIDVVS